MSGKIISNNVLEQYKHDMQIYGLSVIFARMCPDYRDGLKLVQRRTLYATLPPYSEAYKRKVKSANLVGQVMGYFHPHGDSSIYDTMKPMANWNEINIPLLDKEGNFGTFLGDPAAASRYTECKLSDFAFEVLLKPIRESSKTTDWTETYDGTNLEPLFLPSALPMLLINGSFGIAMGLKVDIPRHNINEVIDATLNLINNPNADVVLIPDHSMKCDIIDTDWADISHKGYGSYTVRGKIDIGEFQGKPALFIRSLPDLTFLDTIEKKIESLVAENKIIGIEKLYKQNEGDQIDDLNYTIVLKKGTDPEYIKQVIYSSTEMQQNCRVNMEVLDGLNLVRMDYKSYLEKFIMFRIDIKLRLYFAKMQENETKITEKEPFIKLFQSKDFDKLIELIRNRKDVNDKDLREVLIKKLDITDLQARYIIDAPLKSLSIGYLSKYIEEINKLKEEYNFYCDKVLNLDLIMKDIKDELIYLKNKYGRPRRCKVVSSAEASGIPQGTFKIVISSNNRIKKIGINDPLGNFKDDCPKYIIKVDNTENILLFGSDGKVYKIPVHKIPLCDRVSVGTDIRILVKNLTADICAVIYEPLIKSFTEKKEKYYVTIITNLGMCKKMDINDFLTVAPSGLIYQKLEPGDLVKTVTIAGDALDVITFTKHKALRMSMKDIPYQKRSTKGLKAMNTDIIDGLSIINPNSTDIVVITASGRINRFDVNGLQRMSRNKVGSKVISLSKNDFIVGVYGVNESSILRLTIANEKVDIPVATVPKMSSVSAGTKMIKTSDYVIKVEVINS